MRIFTPGSACSAIHRGSVEFDEGLHELPLVGSAGCDMQFEYRVVVTER